MKKHFVRPRNIAIMTMIVLGIMASFPLIPMEPLFGIKTIAYQASSNSSSLNEYEIDNVLDVVRSHSEYTRIGGEAGYINAYEYLWVYKRIGILSVRDTDLNDKEHRCSICSVVVDTGFTCGGLCGGGATFYLASIDGSWKVVNYTKWVS